MKHDTVNIETELCTSYVISVSDPVRIKNLTTNALKGLKFDITDNQIHIFAGRNTKTVVNTTYKIDLMRIKPATLALLEASFVKRKQ